MRGAQHSCLSSLVAGMNANCNLRPFKGDFLPKKIGTEWIIYSHKYQQVSLSCPDDAPKFFKIKGSIRFLPAKLDSKLFQLHRETEIQQP